MERNKIEVDVELASEEYVVVSCSIKNVQFHGILLRAQNLAFDCEAIGENRTKIAEWKSFVQNNTFPKGCWESDKLSSLCLRQTYFDDSTLNLLKKSNANGVAHGIRRLESRPIRLRPVTHRNGLLCVRCQQHRISTSHSSRFGRNGQRISLQHNYKQPKVEMSLASSSCSIGGETTKKAKKNAQLICDQLFVKKQAAIATKSPPTTTNMQPTVVVEDGRPSAAPTKATTTPPLPLPLPTNTPPRIPTLKISFGKSDSKTTTVISGRSPRTSEALATDVSSSAATAVAGCSKHVVVREEAEETKKTKTLLPDGLRLGDVVWAKMTSYPYWPAKIFDVYDNSSTACVTWCGSTQYGYVDVACLEPFVKCFNKRYNVKRNAAYQKAVADAVNEFREVFQNAYYWSSLSPLCRKAVGSLQAKKQRSNNNKPKHQKSSSNSSDQKRHKSSSSSYLDVSMVKSRLELKSTDEVVEESRKEEKRRPGEIAEEIKEDVDDDERETESPDEIPRLIIDEERNLSSDDVEMSPVFDRSSSRNVNNNNFPSDRSTEPPAPDRPGQGSSAGGGRAQASSSTTSKNQEVDFDSVLSELQEMNEMCAAGGGTSTNSLLTTC